MAQITQTVRVILVPLLTDDGLVQNLFSVPALVQAASNGWFSDLYATINIFGKLTLPNPMVLERVLHVELFTTAANDANLVATSLPALQSELGLAAPLATWSYTAVTGY